MLLLITDTAVVHHFFTTFSTRKTDSLMYERDILLKSDGHMSEDDVFKRKV